MVRERFTSHLTALLTLAGLAIGLGNVWRFPYMMGQSGGSAFLLIYLLCMVLLAVPALTCEWALGRDTRGGPLTAYRTLFGPVIGTWIGLSLLFSVLVVLAYYNLIVAKVIYSAGFAALYGFSQTGFDSYADGLGRPALQYPLAIGVVALSAWIVNRGLRSGIEWVNRLWVPAFGLIALYLVGVALSLDGALPRLREYLAPDFTVIGPALWFAAMGQACFSVGLSGVLHVTYGAYLADSEKLLPTALVTGLMDAGAAILAALFVVPAVLAFGLDMTAGPKLLFDTLPHLFSVMPGGRVLASLFLIGWGLVAILTSVATVDALISGLTRVLPERIDKTRCAVFISAAVSAVMLPIAFNEHWIGTLDLVFGSGMLMLGSLLAVIGTSWGRGGDMLKRQLSLHLSTRTASWLIAWIRYVLPLALIAILGGFLVSPSH